MKTINKILKNSCFALLLLFIGCNNFEEINSNPDAAIQSSASMQCTGVILSNLKFNGKDAHAYLQPHALAKYLGYANQSQMPAQYNRMGAGSFGNMTLLPNIEKMVEYAEGTPMEHSYRGVAKFSRAYLFYNLTMKMGDIPYRETNRGSTGEYRPKFDPQREVLLGILDELKEADAFFANGSKFVGDPTPYAGDPDKWRRATNAFALRVLMSMSGKASDNTLELQKRFADILHSGFILDEATGFLGLSYNTVNRHPMSGTNNLFTSRTVISSLLIDHLKELDDRRLFYFAEPAKGALKEGKKADEMSAYIGVDVSIDYDAMTAQYLNGNFSLINERYLKLFDSEPRVIVSYAEQQLIIAEAHVRGWVTEADAESYYKKGVIDALKTVMNSSADYAHGSPINQAYINNYFTKEAAFKATAEEQLKQIWLQRYILNFMQDGETAYFEYRRNGYPFFPINPSTNLNLENPNAMPLRWLYPMSETNNNRENLVEALNRQYEGYDEVNKQMWLLQE